MEKNVESELNSNYSVVIASHEALSLIRTDPEMERLKMLVNKSGRKVRIVVVLREKEDYLASFTSQLRKSNNLDLNPEKDSISYHQPDSWLVDDAKLLNLYQRHFGDEAVTVLSYERLLKESGSVVPQLWIATGLGKFNEPEKIWEDQSPENTSTPFG